MSSDMSHTCVWFEIPVRDLGAGQAFYEAVLDRPMEYRGDAAPNPMVAFTRMDDNGVSGHLYPGRPATAGTGPTVHLAVADLEAALGRAVAHGGQRVGEIVSIPAGRFGYLTDPDGNSIGLFGR